MDNANHGDSTPSFVSEYPHLSKAMMEVSSIISRLREEVQRNGSNAGMELEARFGRVTTNRRFETGVSQDFMNRAICMANGFGNWYSVTDWMELQDFYYALDDGRQMRTTVRYDPSTKRIETNHIVKEGIVNSDLRCHPTGEYLQDIRVSLSREEKIPIDRIPSMARPSMVRLKQRKSFLYASGTGNKPMWSFDFTMSWIGSSKSDAESNQKSIPPTCEIECECIEPFDYLSIVHHDDYYVACSILLKMADFLGSNSPYDLLPVERTYE